MVIPYNPGTWLWLSALVVVLDQTTKVLAELYLDPLRSLSLLPFFNLTLAYNTGAAFSLLHDAGGWQRYFFIVVSLIVVAFMLRWLRGLDQTQRTLAAALALIVGGAVGNLIDRVATGEVVDFLDLHYAGWHWPAFNLADAAISLGVALLLVDALILERRREL